MDDRDYIPPSSLQQQDNSTPPDASGGGTSTALALKKSIGIFLFLTLYFALICTPFLAASSNPDRNYARFQVFLVDFDGGVLGSSLLQFYQVRILIPSIILTHNSFIHSFPHQKQRN